MTDKVYAMAVVRVINKALRVSFGTGWLQLTVSGETKRIIKARSVKGQVHVKVLSSGKWEDYNPHDDPDIWNYPGFKTRFQETKQ